MTGTETPIATARPARWLVWLASRHWTVAFFLLTAMASLAVARGLMTATALMALPLLLLVVNLVAALLTHPRIRVDPALLLFHLALLALVALLLLARLVYLDGRVTLTSGTPFDGQLQMLRQGPLHPGRLDRLRFVNEGFQEDFYRLGKGRFKSTHNEVRWQDDAGRWHSALIGDDRPLQLDGYRISTTRRRGFSPLFEWRPHTGVPEFGTVQLNAATDQGFFQPTSSWTLPAGPEVWVMLDAEGASPQSGQRSDLGSKALDHRLVLRIGEQRFALTPGQRLDLAEGELTYLRLETWMGYRVSYDPTVPWVMATIVIGLITLTWFYWRRVFA